MKPPLTHITIVLAVAAATLFTNLGATQLMDRDEPRNAGCAAEMMARGDWVVPIFNDQLRDAKPVLTYWLIMSSYQVFGFNEFAARFWSALLGIGTILATYFMGRQLFQPRVGLWAAVILATSTMFCVAARVATPDSPLIFFCTLAIAIYVCGTFRAKAPEEYDAGPILRYGGKWFPANVWVVAAMYSAMGLGILAKGPVALVLPMAIIGMFLLIMRLPQSTTNTTEANPPSNSFLTSIVVHGKNALIGAMRCFAPLHFLRTLWSMRPVSATLIALAIAAPWFVWVGLRTEGDFLTGFFLKEHFGRATQSFENHRGSIFYYPLAICLCFFPWSVFAIPTGLSTWRAFRAKHSWSIGYTFLLCWICVWVGVFTIARTKLPSYVTPCYPALAMLTACFLHHWLKGHAFAGRMWPAIGLGVLCMSGIGLWVGLGIAAERIAPGDRSIALVGLVPLVGGALALLFHFQRMPKQLGVTLGVTGCAFAIAVFGGLMVQVDRHQNNQKLLGYIERNSTEPQLASFRCLESSWVYYAQRPIVELFASSRIEQGHASASASAAREKDWHAHPKPDVVSFFETRSEPFLITTSEHYRDLKEDLPGDIEVLAEADYFLKPGKSLLLLGRSADSKHASQSGSVLR